MPKINFDPNRKLLKLSDLPNQTVTDAGIVLAAAASNAMLLRQHKVGGVEYVAQFLLDEGQRRMVRNLKKKAKS